MSSVDITKDQLENSHMARYLDPKNDLVFKRVFGEHPDILRSFLNALLPLGPDEKIVSLEYLSPESVPPIPTMKFTIVDVRCRDKQGRQFIVEMQMQWTTSFLQRVYFNASRAYVSQLELGKDFKLLQPVFGLSLINDIFAPQKTDFYHHYKMVNIKDVDQDIKGLQLVFIELPKFSAAMSDNPDLVAWLTYLRETGKAEAPLEDLAANGPEMQQALHLAESAAYTRAELEGYYKYGDAVSTEKMMLSDKLEEGMAKGLQQGLEKGLQEGLAKGLQEGIEMGIKSGVSRGLELAVEKLVATGMSLEQARNLLGIEHSD